MKWIKKGQIFEPKGNPTWMQTHAALPVVDRMSGDLYRIYFSTRDSKNRASIGFIEININDPTNILQISDKPILSLGDSGSFDDNGIMASCIVNVGSRKFLYYIGWNQGVSVPFRWAIGLAISDDGGKTFLKYSKGPILDRNTVDHYFVASPIVMKEENVWKMWYLSGIKSETVNGKPIIPYHIRYAESLDGINWQRNGQVCIDLRKNETRIARVSILKEKNIYKMWYPYAIDSYRIGYAESSDGIIWERKDEEVGMDVSVSGWDSEMIEYPFVFQHGNTKLMIYNGNNYGKTGFGYAILQ